MCIRWRRLFSRTCRRVPRRPSADFVARRWPWTSFAASCSTAGYVFLYSARAAPKIGWDGMPLSVRLRRAAQVYYFFVKTKMSGFFQTIFYFGYSALARTRQRVSKQPI